MYSIQLEKMNQINGGSKLKDAADGFCFVVGIAGIVAPNPVSVGCYIYGGGRLLNLW
jgi:hypothetical protein